MLGATVQHDPIILVQLQYFPPFSSNTKRHRFLILCFPKHNLSLTKSERNRTPLCGYSTHAKEK